MDITYKEALELKENIFDDAICSLQKKILDKTPQYNPPTCRHGITIGVGCIGCINNI